MKRECSQVWHSSTVILSCENLIFWRNRNGGCRLEILVLTFCMILFMSRDMLCRIDSSFIFRMKIFDIRCVQSVRQIFSSTLRKNSKKCNPLPSSLDSSIRRALDFSMKVHGFNPPQSQQTYSYISVIFLQSLMLSHRFPIIFS